MSQQLELLTESLGQWTTAMFVIPEVQKKEIKPFFILSLKELEGKPDSRVASLTNADKYSAVRAVVRHVARLRSAIKEPWNAADIHNFLEHMKFSPECAEELTTLLCTDKIYKNIPKHLQVKPGLVSLQWRIDLSLCGRTLAEYDWGGTTALPDILPKKLCSGLKGNDTSVITGQRDRPSYIFESQAQYRAKQALCPNRHTICLSCHYLLKKIDEGLKVPFLNFSQNYTHSENTNPQRVKEIVHQNTHIILIFKLTDGQTKMYRLSIAKFHELRFVIASALKSMIVLEKRKCMRAD